MNLGDHPTYNVIQLCMHIFIIHYPGQCTMSCISALYSVSLCFKSNMRSMHTICSRFTLHDYLSFSSMSLAVPSCPSFLRAFTRVLHVGFPLTVTTLSCLSNQAAATSDGTSFILSKVLKARPRAPPT